MNLKVSILFTIIISTSSCLPAPQSESEIDADDDYNEFYGDFDGSSETQPTSGSVGDILRSGAGLAGSLLSLFNQKELRDQVGNTVSTGLKLTGDIINAGVPLARSAIQQ